MRIALVSVAAALVFTAACAVDTGAILTGTAAVELGKADTVRAEIHMSAGELWIEGGSSRLLDANFRYSERVGRPSVHYDAMGGRGVLTIESPEKDGLKGNAKNEWRLRMSSGAPLDLSVSLGAGESHLDLSQITLRA
ncbi:MAG TPA: toast rack family protein, partial [Bryobacteraceae bacterium]|nr:toast rack family protein [Bryobacteraceae bacterium]